MCGIAGFVGPRDHGLLRRMLDSIRHRGPDGDGMWEADNVSLGMRRLAIVDLRTGDQPLFNQDRSVVCVFNGEIYNHVELRAELEGRGHRFRTDHADGEVIPHLYDRYGDGFLDRLDGMFAIALWDLRSRRLLLARDRLGIKPLYVAVGTGGRFAFGSEPKALLPVPWVDQSPDPVALHHYLSFKHVPAPMSAFRGIRQLARRRGLDGGRRPAGGPAVVAPERGPGRRDHRGRGGGDHPGAAGGRGRRASRWPTCRAAPTSPAASTARRSPPSWRSRSAGPSRPSPWSTARPCPARTPTGSSRARWPRATAPTTTSARSRRAT